MQKPGVYNMEWIAGTSLVQQITVVDTNITGCTVVMQVRKGLAPDNGILLNLRSDGASPAIVLTTPLSGVFTITYTVPTMTVIDANANGLRFKDAMYGINITSSGGVILPYLVGKISIKAGYVE